MKTANKEEREEMLKEKIRDLNDITELFIAKVRELLTLRKFFGRIFIYDGMDYIKVVVNEMR
jgi:hypothetical protein